MTTMEIKTPLKFETFTDGLLDIHNVSGNKLAEKVETLSFGNQVIGVKRNYAARSVNVEINKLVRVPLREYLTNKHNAVISGERFKIEQVQHIHDSNPPKTVLTLRQLEIAKVV